MQRANAGTLGALVKASNKQTQNFAAAAAAITDLTSRMGTVEGGDPRYNALEATVQAQAAAIQVLMARTSAAVPAPTTVPYVPLEELAPEALHAVVTSFLNANGKRAREGDVDDAVRNVRAHIADAPPPPPLVAVPQSFVYNAGALQQSQAQPAAYAAPPLVAYTAPPVAPAAPLVAPAAPTVVYAAPAHVVHAAAAAPPPFAPPSAPLPPQAPAPPGPPAAERDPAREVVIGPVSWNKDAVGKLNIPRDVGNLIRVVLPDAGHPHFRTRRAHDPSYTICTFESAGVADWIIKRWAAVDHGAFSVITATHPNA
ncbi:hypothetical protein C8R43DRAFT_675965 [Mycena crocata]|nr:hypothetical protein C8R43DRAFT_675965 [Mycena crocata]